MDEINSWKILDPAKRRTRKSKDRSEKKNIQDTTQKDRIMDKSIKKYKDVIRSNTSWMIFQIY